MKTFIGRNNVGKIFLVAAKNEDAARLILGGTQTPQDDGDDFAIVEAAVPPGKKFLDVTSKLT